MKKTNEESTTTKKEVIVTPEDSNQQVISKRHVGFWKALAVSFLSRKFLTTLFILCFIWICHEVTVNHIYSMWEPYQVAALNTMYIATLSAISAIGAAFLGFNTIQSKFSVTSAAGLLGQAISEKSDRNENQNIKREETINENIKEEGVNAPELKPFGQHAVGDEQEGEYKDL